MPDSDPFKMVPQPREDWPYAIFGWFVTWWWSFGFPILIEISLPLLRETPLYVYTHTMVRLNVRLPDDLKRRFKAACAEEGLEMTDKVLAWIRQWLDEREKRSRK